MRKPILLPVLLCCLSFPSARAASAQAPATLPSASTAPSKGNIEILSDTQGVDFSPYLRGLMQQIHQQMDSLMPPEAMSPTFAKGQASIRLSIAPDGSITGMHLDNSSHNDKINRACWGAITANGHFNPLPSAFKGPSLIVRINFLVNMTQP